MYWGGKNISRNENVLKVLRESDDNSVSERRSNSMLFNVLKSESNSE